jgi:two-component system cell cycle response regulator DivK
MAADRVALTPSVGLAPDSTRIVALHPVYIPSGSQPFTFFRGALVERKTVLVVDDDPDCRIIYSKLLQHAGYGVIEAQDGREGVRRAQEHRPNLIVMDLRLPMLDGWQAAEQIRQDPEMAGTPIIAFTAQVIPGDDARAHGAGFVRYFAKPVEPHDVLHDIQERIGPANPV